MKSNLIHSKDGRVTIYLITSKGAQFRGISRCNSTDEINTKLGDDLAKCRAELAVQQYHLKEFRFAKEKMLHYIYDLPVSQSKLWTKWYQEACESEKITLKRIRNLKKQIKDLCNGIR
jgi:hypothetical protein